MDSATLLAMADDLANSIRGTEVYTEYKKCIDELERDREMHILYNEYCKVGKEILERQRNNDIIEKYEFNHYRDLLSSISNSPLIMNFVRKHKAYLDLLEMVQKAVMDE
jgi:cell fate (sporulation/competence/biofilm development) regulator YlbF (YheA/YmcA/DUF963 family)